MHPIVARVKANNLIIQSNRQLNIYLQHAQSTLSAITIIHNTAAITSHVWTQTVC